MDVFRDAEVGALVIARGCDAVESSVVDLAVVDLAGVDLAGVDLAGVSTWLSWD